MEKYDIYKQIAERTQGDIYIGVVGPVRTGKSTFIKRFMDLMVLPNIDNEFQRERTIDELPQSSTGKTIMTTEPKFVPNEAIEITVDGALKLNVRLVDCVGYIVKGALGYIEENAPRMVSTPWHDHKVPFEEAAETGTRKVINEHSTIGVVVVTDGTITDLSRDEYIEAEERVIKEMKATGKPFVILLNSADSDAPETEALRQEVEAKYEIPALTVNCARMQQEDITRIMEKTLYEFPITEIGMDIPGWITSLDDDHWFRNDMLNAIRDTFSGARKLSEIKPKALGFDQYDFIKRADIDTINAGDGTALIRITIPESMFYNILSETTGLEIASEKSLVNKFRELARVKRDYDKIEFALNEVREKGYGIVAPQMDELTLEEPEIVRHGTKFGIKLRASAPSYHFIRADIETEISPLVGTERQSEELVNYILREFEGDPGKIWESNIFGKSLHELIKEGVQNKLFKMPEDAQLKLQETLQRIINEGSAGLICIIL